MHIDTIDWSCFGLSCQWSSDNDSVLCRSTETRVVVVPNGKTKIVPLKSYWLFWVLQEHGQSFPNVLLLHISWGMSSVVQFCSLSGFCLCTYMHMQVHIKKRGQVQSYTSYMHKSFFIERQTHTKILSLSLSIPRLKLRESHSRYRSTSYVKEYSSPYYRAGWGGEMRTQT